MQVFSTFCESHTSEVPFHASNRLLRGALGVNDLDDEAARDLLRTRVPDTDPADVLLLEDELGVRDAAVELPDIAPDARRRRLAALINTLALTSDTPAVFIIEDAHWIDPTSESLLADFFSVIPQTHSLVLITFRPEYQGALSRTPGAQTIAMTPLDDSQTAALAGDLLGLDPSVTALKSQIAERAAGKPLFAEEIVRDLVGRGVLAGERGAYQCPDADVQVSVPATLQAAIAARIDRLDHAAKRTLNAAAVIGLRFGDAELRSVIEEPATSELIKMELIDQVKFTPALHEAAEAFDTEQRYGDDFTLECARAALGLVLVRHGGPDRAEGFRLLSEAREAAMNERSTMILVPIFDLERAKERARTGDLDGGVELLCAVVDDEVKTGEIANRGAVVAALVEALLARGTESDVRESQAAIDSLAAVPVDPDFVVYEIHLLRMRALLARAQRDEARYRELVDRYRALATSADYEGHMALAEAMT